MCYFWHIRASWSRSAALVARSGSPEKPRTGAWRFHAEVVSAKAARMKSGSKGPKKTAKASGSRASSKDHGRSAKNKSSRDQVHAKSKTAKSVMAKTAH